MSAESPWVLNPASWVEVLKGIWARRVVVVDAPTTKTPFTFKVSAIGHVAGEAVELDLTGKGLTRYRFEADHTMRVAEDAVNVAQAESWLQVGAAPLADGEILCKPPVAADKDSGWRYFPDDKELTNLWFLADTAVAGKTAIVECE